MSRWFVFCSDDHFVWKQILLKHNKHNIPCCLLNLLSLHIRIIFRFCCGFWTFSMYFIRMSPLPPWLPKEEMLQTGIYELGPLGTPSAAGECSSRRSRSDMCLRIKWPRPLLVGGASFYRPADDEYLFYMHPSAWDLREIHVAGRTSSTTNSVARWQGQSPREQLAQSWIVNRWMQIKYTTEQTMNGLRKGAMLTILILTYMPYMRTVSVHLALCF